MGLYLLLSFSSSRQKSYGCLPKVDHGVVGDKKSTEWGTWSHHAKTFAKAVLFYAMVSSHDLHVASS